MKTQSEIERLADETLKSIDHIQQVEANSFLFTRIEAQLSITDNQQSFAAIKYLSRVSIALVLFISLNVISYYVLLRNEPAQTVKQKGTATEALASEFDLNTNQYSY